MRGRWRFGAFTGYYIGAARRGATLTARLLAFARKQPLKPEATDVNVLLREIEPLLRRTVRENIALALSLHQPRHASIDERVTDLLKHTQLLEQQHHYPSQLSGGQQQRVGHRTAALRVRAQGLQL